MRDCALVCQCSEGLVILHRQMETQGKVGHSSEEGLCERPLARQSLLSSGVFIEGVSSCL